MGRSTKQHNPFGTDENPLTFHIYIYINLAKLFMGKFETDLPNDYRNKYNKSPGIWLRYIDNIFFTWDHDESSLKESKYQNIIIH